MITIRLKDVKINAGHGVYSGEALVGNNYLLDLWVKYPETERSFENLDETIDYGELYQIVMQRMAVDTPLLEKLCNEILMDIRLKYPKVQESEITIYKLQAAINNLEGKVGVSLYKKFDD